MVLGVLSPDFIKRSASQPLRASPSSQQRVTQGLGSPPKAQPPASKATTQTTEQLVVPKQRNFSKPFSTGSGTGSRRKQSESLSTSLSSSTQIESNQSSKISSGGTQTSQLEDQNCDVIHKLDPSRRVKSCSLPQARISGEEGQEANEGVRSRSTSLGERLKIDDRARTWGGVPSTEMTVSGRTFWRSVLGSSAREREGGGGG